MAFSQGLSFLDVSLEKVGTNVVVYWEVAAGNQCQNVEIQHSLNGKDFETFYTYAGICGDPNVTLGYEYTHNSPVLNHFNYYRIKVNQDITSPLREFVPGNNKIVLLRGNIYTDRSIKVEFQDLGGPFVLSVFSMKGNLLFTEKYKDLSRPVYAPEFSNSLICVLIIEQNGIVRSTKY